MTRQTPSADTNHRPKASHKNPRPPKDDLRDDPYARLEAHHSQIMTFRLARFAETMREGRIRPH